jgi:hypothetical protein
VRRIQGLEEEEVFTSGRLEGSRISMCILCVLDTDNKQACFSLKGAELPLDMSFSNSFIAEFIRACRRYKNDSASGLDLTSSSHGQPSEVDPSSPVSPAKHRASMRKSEQHGGPHQHYETLVFKSNATANASPVPDPANGLAGLSLMSRTQSPRNLPNSREDILYTLEAKQYLQKSLVEMVRCNVGF